MSQKYSDNNSINRHTALEFCKEGTGKLVGIFDDYKKQMREIFESDNNLDLDEF